MGGLSIVICIRNLVFFQSSLSTPIYIYLIVNIRFPTWSTLNKYTINIVYMEEEWMDEETCDEPQNCTSLHITGQEQCSMIPPESLWGVLQIELVISPFCLLHWDPPSQPTNHSWHKRASVPAEKVMAGQVKPSCIEKCISSEYNQLQFAVLPIHTPVLQALKCTGNRLSRPSNPNVI